MTKLIFPKYGWFALNTVVLIVDIIICACVFSVNYSKKKYGKNHRIESAYSNYTFSVLFQTLLCFVITTSTSFVNLETIKDSIVIESDSQRYIEYLSITCALILPNIVLYFMFVSRLMNFIGHMS
jgi:hypothetical protein